MPKVIGVSRIRNESEIIERCLDNMATFVDEILIYDDASEDNTVEICVKHPAVKLVVEAEEWGYPPDEHEGKQRHFLCHEALSRGAEWVWVFDADDYPDFQGLDLSVANTIKIRNFDLYITPEDVDKPYYEREWMGPEYRDFIALFRMHDKITFKPHVGREPWVSLPPRVWQPCHNKHYSKAISVERWERLCNYYATYYGVYAKKWAARRGKAIHTVSDFGRPLIKWKDRFDKSKIVSLHKVQK